MKRTEQATGITYLDVRSVSFRRGAIHNDVCLYSVMEGIMIAQKSEPVPAFLCLLRGARVTFIFPRGATIVPQLARRSLPELVFG